MECHANSGNGLHCIKSMLYKSVHKVNIHENYHCQDLLMFLESASYESCMKNALQPGVTPHLAEDKHKQMYVIKQN
jgi:hypothetical protein